MPNFEAIAGIEAAARFLIEEGMDHLAAAESEVFGLSSPACSRSTA